MQANIQIGILLDNTDLADLASRICAGQGWSVWQCTSRAFNNALPIADVLLFDDLSFLPEIRRQLEQFSQSHAIYVSANGDDIGLPHRCTDLDEANLDKLLIGAVTTALNVARFENQFFQSKAAEPITQLPRHAELLDYMQRYQGTAMGLIVLQIDHAEHLYVNLDPVSKTDLLGALGEHLQTCLPVSAHMGIFDAACFAVWCPHMSSVQVAKTANQLIARGVVPLNFKGGELHFSLSAGHVHATNLDHPQSLWQQAWHAKEEAQAKGGNRSVNANTGAALGARIPEAMNRDEFGLVLQPQWDIHGSRVKGVETLLRWQGLEVGNIAPDHFIPIAERNGQMARVGDWVLERACCESASWLADLGSPILLGINVSPQQFVNQAIQTQVQRLHDDNWLDPTTLELEMSHEKLLSVVDQHRTTLFALRDLGVRIAIDNLGTGVVDTNKLLRCPADTLKIDRSLIAQIESNSAARTLVAQICQVGVRFSLRVVAVGVETEHQRALLENLGCSDAQGYLFAEPVALDDFQDYLQSLADKKPNAEVAERRE